ncbi:proactivator polypeptide-like 1 [Momordica charantia]|uniref:Pulmonary surfactant-associated protein B n=1 Tax=Momordica charantia TaxID=3673 RepID=A0A6J1CS32_MOMCH|nr:proactivator polypeptide-like 1 [Momordica charantia]XP_022143994.1 proactivator polypeptide-like 1 [Momordica charantia]
MDLRFGLIFLLVVGAAWDCDARNLASSDSELSYLRQEKDNEALSEASEDPKICKLCESLVSQTVEYLADNKTQDEITVILRKTCAVLGLFNEKCISLVDYYAPLFFSEISSIEPTSFCQSARFCEQITVMSLQIQENSCGFCHQTVSKMVEKLKDPNTQIEILETLLNMCNSLGYRVKECKRLVFEYGPLIVAKSEKILENTDICRAIHACPAVAGGDNTTSFVGTLPALADA